MARLIFETNNKLQLRDTILQKHSKEQRDKIVQWVGDDQKRFDQLLKLFLHDEHQVTQRAGWPLSYCIQGHPRFIKKGFAALIRNLHKQGIHDAVKRNTVRILQDIEIPKKHQGQVMNICFTYLESMDEAVAVKAFSLTVLGKLARLYPDILREIKLLIGDQLANQTPAFISRAKKILKEFPNL